MENVVLRAGRRVQFADNIRYREELRSFRIHPIQYRVIPSPPLILSIYIEHCIRVCVEMKTSILIA